MAGASTLIKDTMLRGSVGLSRNSTAATSSVPSTPGRISASCDGSWASGVARYRRGTGRDGAARGGTALLAKLSCLLFQIGFPLALGCERIHPRAMGKCALTGRDIFGLPGPRLLRRGLQRPAIGERKAPR